MPVKSTKKLFFARDNTFYRTLLRLLVVVALQNVLSYSVNVADNLMLGRYSQAALSGAATVNQIQFLVQQITIAIGDAVVMLNAQYWGRQDLSAIRSLTGVGLKVGLVFGMLVLGVTTLFPRQLLWLFTTDEEIIAAGLEYLGLLKYTYVFYVMTTIMLAALRSVEVVQIAFGISAMSLIVNVGINYTLIFGNFGFPEMGVRGAAVGTLTARILEFCVVLVYILRVDKKLRLFTDNPFRRNRQLFRDYRRVAVPVVLTNLLWSLATPIQTGILGHLSADAIAANSVATTMFQYLKVITVSEASATSVVVGKMVGAGTVEKHGLQPYVHALQAIFLVIGFLLGGVLLLIRGPLLSFYALSPSAMTLAGQLLLLMVLIFVGMAYQMPASVGIVRGGGETKFNMRLNLISTWAIVMPLSFAAAFWWKLPVFWVVFCLNCDQIFKCIPVAIYTNQYRWVHQLTRKT